MKYYSIQLLDCLYVLKLCFEICVIIYEYPRFAKATRYIMNYIIIYNLYNELPKTCDPEGYSLTKYQLTSKIKSSRGKLDTNVTGQ